MGQEATKNKRAFRRDLAIVKKLWPGQVHGIQRESLRRTLSRIPILGAVRRSPALGRPLVCDAFGIAEAFTTKRMYRHPGSSSPRVCGRCQSHRWVFKATVYKARDSKGFVGYGDADPSNISPLVRGAEMRVAETRAVNRALRKAYGIGLCSVEELGSSSSSRSSRESRK